MLDYTTEKLMKNDLFQSASSSNNGGNDIALSSGIGGRRQPSQQSFQSSKNNHSHLSRTQTPQQVQQAPTTPRNAYQIPETTSRCIRESFNSFYRLDILFFFPV
jgi:hypothetical protein